MSVLPIKWSMRAVPLEPEAVWAIDRVAERLARRLMSVGDEEPGPFKVLANDRILIAFAQSDSLPWVRGVQYLGRDSAADDLYLPTCLVPQLPIELLARSLAERYGNRNFAVLEPGGWVVPVDGLLPLDRGALKQWLERTVGAATQ